MGALRCSSRFVRPKRSMRGAREDTFAYGKETEEGRAHAKEPRDRDEGGRAAETGEPENKDARGKKRGGGAKGAPQQGRCTAGLAERGGKHVLRVSQGGLGRKHRLSRRTARATSAGQVPERAGRPETRRKTRRTTQRAWAVGCLGSPARAPSETSAESSASVTSPRTCGSKAGPLWTPNARRERRTESTRRPNDGRKRDREKASKKPRTAARWSGCERCAKGDAGMLRQGKGWQAAAAVGCGQKMRSKKRARECATANVRRTSETLRCYASVAVRCDEIGHVGHGEPV